MERLFSFPPAARGVAESEEGLDAATAGTSSVEAAPAGVEEPVRLDHGHGEEEGDVNGNGNVAEGTPTPVVEMAAAEDEVTAAVAGAVGMLRVRLKLLDERVFDVEVDPQTAVAAFRVKVAEVTEVPVHLQRLIYRGKLLKDGVPLAQYAIQDGHTVHLVAKPVGTASTLTQGTEETTTRATETTPIGTEARAFAARESTFLARGVHRNRARLQQILRAANDTTEPGRSSMLREPGVLRPQPITRRRGPGEGEPAGNAWNLAVLREALGQTPTTEDDGVRSASPSMDYGAMSSFGETDVPERGQRTSARGQQFLRAAQRRGSERHQMAQNDTLASAAADLGLDATPNLDHITQGIMTLRTILSTAALPDAETAGNGDENDESERENRTGDAERPIRDEGIDVQSQATELQADMQREQDGDEPTAAAQEIHVLEAEAGETDDRDRDRVESPRTFRRGQRRFFVGQWLDVKDTVNQWLECTVIDIANGKVLVHFHGWPSRWDEWIDFDSNRIAAFRSRTAHTLNAHHASPMPATRLHSAPNIGEHNIRAVVPQLRDIMLEVLPHVQRFASLCEEQDEGDDSLDDQGIRAAELSEMAHLVAPLFDRFGRLLTDSARQFNPLLRSDLQQRERGRRRRTNTSRRSGGRTSSRSESMPPNEPLESEDSTLNIRDLIEIATRPAVESQHSGQRNVDVHIHAIVSPSSLSSLASLARLGSAIAGAVGQRSTGFPTVPMASMSTSASTPPLTSRTTAADLEESFGLPSLRPLQPGTQGRTLVTDMSEPEDEDFRHSDNSRTPLLSSFRSEEEHERSRRSSTSTQRRVSDNIADFLSDDFFGPSFSQDSDNIDDDPMGGSSMFAVGNNEDDHLMRYHPIPSPRGNHGDNGEHEGTNVQLPRIGVIPEIAEAEAREREQNQNHRTNTDQSSEVASDSNERSSTTSNSSSGFPTFLEVMRRTLSGVRGFSFGSSGDHAESERSRSSSSSSSPSSSSSASSSPSWAFDSLSSLVGSPDRTQTGTTTSRQRDQSDASLSSIEEDLDSVD